MKMISSTSITSTIGVTLISAIGVRRPRRPGPRIGPIAMLYPSTSSSRDKVPWKPSAKRCRRASIRLMP